MKNLKQELLNAGLSDKQALDAIQIFRDYLVANSYDPDLVEEIKIKAKVQYNKLSDKADAIAGKIDDKTDEWISKARHQAKKAADKVSEYLDDEK